MIAQIKHAYGFDRPLPVQYLLWLGHVLTGDFGMSIATRRPVILEVTGALSNTFMLTSFAVPLAFIIGYTMGAIAGCFPGPRGRPRRHRRRGGRRQPAQLLARHRAGHHLRRRADGAARHRHGPARARREFSILHWSDARYLVLPVVTLSMIPVGIIARTTRAAVAEVLNQDFVTTLRAKGLSRDRGDPPRAEEFARRRCWR